MTNILSQNNLTSLFTMKRLACAALFFAATSFNSYAEWTTIGTTETSTDDEVFDEDAKTKDGKSLAGELKVKKWNKCSESGFYYTIFKDGEKIAYEKFDHPATLHTDKDNNGKCDACDHDVIIARVYRGNSEVENVLTTSDGDNLKLSGNDIAYLSIDDKILAAKLALKFTTIPMPNVVINGKTTLAAFYSDKSLYIPEGFTANYAGLAYTPSVYANNESGWQSVVLPFQAKEVYAGTSEVLNKVIATKDYKDYEVKVLLSEGEGNFWLKELTESQPGMVGFSNLSEQVFNAYTPYLIAIPGNYYGEESMEGQTLAFVGRNINIQATADADCKKATEEYVMRASFEEKTVNNVYVLEPYDNTFKFMSSTVIRPFQSYMEGGSAIRSLVIYDADDEDVATGVASATKANDFKVYSVDGSLFVSATEAGVATILSLDGKVIAVRAYNQGISEIGNLDAGVYVVNGNLVVVK